MTGERPWLERLLWCESTLEVQAALALAQAALWWAFVPWFGERVVRRYVDRAPWGAQWYELNRATRKYLSPPEADKVAREMCGILLQHQIGALLVVPAMVGALQPELASALALHGALCEVGWELQDAVVRIYDVLFCGEEGKMRQPAELLRLMLSHHVMGLSMVLPMNIFFRDYAVYHEGLFLMQGVAAAALTLQQVGYTLDATTQSGRRQLLGVSAVVWAMLVYGRGFRYVWLVYKILLALHASGSFVMVVCGVVAAAMMCTVNSLFLADATRKLYKYVHLTLQPEPKEAKARVERAKMIKRATSSCLGAGNGVAAFVQENLVTARWETLRQAVKIGQLAAPKNKRQ